MRGRSPPARGHQAHPRGSARSSASPAPTATRSSRSRTCPAWRGPRASLGLLIVRGSAPQDTQTFIDGTPVPLIYHFGGLSSVVPTEVLAEDRLLPRQLQRPVRPRAGRHRRRRPARPQERVPRPRPGRPHRRARSWSRGRSPASRAGPSSPPGGAATSTPGSARCSRAAGAGVTQAPVYYDYQFMVAKKPTPDSQLPRRLLRLGRRPRAPPRQALSRPAGARRQLRPPHRLPAPPAPLRQRPRRAATGSTCVARLRPDELDFGAGLALLQPRLPLDHRPRRVHARSSARASTLDAGLDMLGGYYDVAARLPPPPRPGPAAERPLLRRHAVADRTSPAAPSSPRAYLEAEIAPDGRSRIVPGVRLDYFNITEQLRLLPPHQRPLRRPQGVPAHHAQGRRRPLPPAAPVPGGEPRPSATRTSSRTGPSSTRSASSRRSPSSSRSRVEGFYKQLDNQVVSARLGLGRRRRPTPTTAPATSAAPRCSSSTSPTQHFFGWLAYTLSRSVAHATGPGQPEHLFQYDQTHILTVLGSYNFGHGWEFGARFRLISGNLVTPNVCDASLRELRPRPAPTPSSTPPRAPTSPSPLSGPYSERLPLFHQLDMRVDKTLEVQDAGSSRPTSTCRTSTTRPTSRASPTTTTTPPAPTSAGLPILPSIGLRGEF